MKVNSSEYIRRDSEVSLRTVSKSGIPINEGVASTMRFLGMKSKAQGNCDWRFAEATREERYKKLFELNNSGWSLTSWSNSESTKVVLPVPDLPLTRRVWPCSFFRKLISSGGSVKKLTPILSWFDRVFDEEFGNDLKELFDIGPVLRRSFHIPKYPQILNHLFSSFYLNRTIRG
jgi:hypothetical protein